MNVPAQLYASLMLAKFRFASACVTAVLRPMAELRPAGGARMKMYTAEVYTTLENAKRHMLRA